MASLMEATVAGYRLAIELGQRIEQLRAPFQILLELLNGLYSAKFAHSEGICPFRALQAQVVIFSGSV